MDKQNPHRADPAYLPQQEQQVLNALGIQHPEDVSIIRWHPLSAPPDNESIVMLKYYEPRCDQITIGYFVYDSGEYLRLPNVSREGAYLEYPKTWIYGWSYPLLIPRVFSLD
jgi:hypothetical protein